MIEFNNIICGVKLNTSLCHRAVAYVSGAVAYPQLREANGTFAPPLAV